MDFTAYRHRKPIRNPVDVELGVRSTSVDISRLHVGECPRFHHGIQIHGFQRGDCGTMLDSSQGQQSRIFHRDPDHLFEFWLPVILTPFLPVSKVCISFQVQRVISLLDDFLNRRR